MKHCVDCAHHKKFRLDISGELDYCYAEESPVRGNKRRGFAHLNRQFFCSCGPAARWFVPKPITWYARLFT
jgi:hypothetical protein